VLIRDQCAAAEDSAVFVLRDATLEDAIKVVEADSHFPADFAKGCMSIHKQGHRPDAALQQIAPLVRQRAAVGARPCPISVRSGGMERRSNRNIPKAIFFMAAPDGYAPEGFQCKRWTSNLSVKHQSERCGTDQHRIGRRELLFEFCQRSAVATRGDHAWCQFLDW
jgi:hypothetical protein